MSSVAENNSRLSQKRGFFLRSSSIQKIKCSATYPFRIAGSKLSRDAIKQLLEVLIIKARLFSQKALLVLYIATFRILSAVLHLSVGTSAKRALDDEVCDKIKKTEKELTFRERILARAIKLQNHKKQIEAKATTDTSIKKESPTVKCSKPVVTLASNLFPSDEVKPTKQNYFFVVFVYASAVLIYLQLLILAVALNTTQIPPGLVFLISSLLFIAVILFKVLHRNKRSKLDTFRTRTTNQQEEKTANDIVPETRRSRMRLQKTIGTDLTSKTLSKIKLL